MSKVRWSADECLWLLTNRDKYRTYAELAAALNEACGGERTAGAIKNRLNHVYGCGMGRAEGVPYTDAERRYILDNHKTMTLRELSDGLHGISGRRVTKGAIGHYMTDTLGITRCGRRGRLQAGDRIGYVAPIGSEAINADGYTLVKVSDTGVKNEDWKTKQAVMWERYHGERPGGVVVFLNADRTDFSEDNLHCLSRQAHGLMCLNGWYTENRERTLAAIRLCELMGAIKRTLKDEEGAEK